MPCAGSLNGVTLRATPSRWRCHMRQPGTRTDKPTARQHTREASGPDVCRAHLRSGTARRRVRRRRLVQAELGDRRGARCRRLPRRRPRLGDRQLGRHSLHLRHRQRWHQLDSAGLGDRRDAQLSRRERRHSCVGGGLHRQLMGGRRPRHLRHHGRRHLGRADPGGDHRGVQRRHRPPRRRSRLGGGRERRYRRHHRWRRPLAAADLGEHRGPLRRLLQRCRPRLGGGRLWHHPGHHATAVSPGARRAP